MRGFANKYRPNNIEDLCGIAKNHGKVLMKHVVNNTLPVTLLFHGSKGTGKTTMARILAKALNCENPTSNGPCGICKACQVEDLGIHEINAANNRGIDNIRQITENMRISPTWGARHKVYVIDEAHELTREAQDALLKPAEDGFPDVTLVLCTTDPNKLLPTLRSRSIPYEFKNVGIPELVMYLQKIASKNYYELSSTSGLEIIARYASGCVRDAINILGEAISAGTINYPETLRKLYDEYQEDAQAVELARTLWGKYIGFKQTIDLLNNLLLTTDAEVIRMTVLSYGLKTINSEKDTKRIIALGFFVDSFKELTVNDRKTRLRISLLRALSAIHI